MTEKDVIDYVKFTLTGDNQVDLECKDTAITAFIQDGVRKVKPWYYERALYETIVVQSSGEDSVAACNSKFFDVSALSKPLDEIKDIYNVKQVSAGASDIDSNLYGLQSRMVYTADLRYAAYYQGFQNQLNTFVANGLTWIRQGNRVFISGYFFENRVTICYCPTVTTIDDITQDNVLTWVREYALAKTMESVSRIRGKFTGGDLNLETDASEMVSTAQTALQNLEEGLSNLQFRIILP